MRSVQCYLSATRPAARLRSIICFLFIFTICPPASAAEIAAPAGNYTGNSNCARAKLRIVHNWVGVCRRNVAEEWAFMRGAAHCPC